MEFYAPGIFFSKILAPNIFIPGSMFFFPVGFPLQEFFSENFWLQELIYENFFAPGIFFLTSTIFPWSEKVPPPEAKSGYGAVFVPFYSVFSWFSSPRKISLTKWFCS